MLGTILKIGAALILGGVALAATVGIAGLIYDRIQERITKSTVQKHLAGKIREKLDAGDYQAVNIGLVNAEIIDISEKDGDTYVAYEVEGERFGIRSSKGTSLSENERLTLSF